MRQLSSRVFDLALGAACALLLIGSAGTVEEHPAEAAGKPEAGPTVETADASLRVPDPSAGHDRAAADLEELVARGRSWRLATTRGPIHVWIPQGYDPATAITVLYVHGYHATADEVWRDHRLAEQFALSGINALFVVPEAPVGKRDPITWSSPSAVLREVKAGINVREGEPINAREGEPVIDLPLPRGRIAAIGHSGAYRTLIRWLADPRLDTVVLLDAAYVDVRPYRAWLVKARKRRLVNVSIDTVALSDRLHRTLPSTRVVEGFPREITDELRAARIVYIRSDIKHWPLVTEGVALPAMLRALRANRLLDHDPPLGLPPAAPVLGPALGPAPDPTLGPAPDPTLGPAPAPDPTLGPAPDPTLGPAPDPALESATGPSALLERQPE